jgi:L-aspartate oxidase
MKSGVDILIIGSGIAGLSFALKSAQRFPDKQILIATKSHKIESNTRYAQGGIAGVLDPSSDSFDSHIADTLKAGDYLNDRSVVEMVVEEAPHRLKELISWGTSFDRKSDGSFDLVLEGGHSANRILHHKDVTGFEIQKTLLEKIARHKNIRIVSHYYATDLLVSGDVPVCSGAVFLNASAEEKVIITASVTYLATGGAGQVYQNTTNPGIATGDGIAMAYRAGARIENMEFIQFHPTAFYSPGENPAFLISEAVRGMGAVLVDEEGNSFMEKYSDKGSLACRDVVSRAIDLEMKQRKLNHVFLDCIKLDPEKFRNHFPNIYHYCLDHNINPLTQPIPVVPAAHYCCGGIKTDRYGRTNIVNLFAGGECASTGLHGANRLASNSLLEALVFAHNSCEFIFPWRNDIFCMEYFQPPVVTDFNTENNYDYELSLLKYKLKEIMSRFASIVRTEKFLTEGLSELQGIEDLYKLIETNSIQAVELKNLITIAKLIISQSLERKENRGCFYNLDLERKREEVV